MKYIDFKKNKLIIIALSIVVIIAAYIYFSGREYRAAKKCLRTYINAVVSNDFDTIFKYHWFSQRRVAVATKYPETMDAQIKEIYREQKALFDEAQLISNIKEMWSEKFFLIRDMKYRILNVKMVEDTENPTSPIRERIDTMLEVEVEYTNQETAPSITDRKIKNIVYLIRMTNSKNVVRVLVKEMEDRRWLFRSIDIKMESLIWW